MVMNWSIPILRLDVTNYGLSCLVNTDSNNLDFIAPVCSSLIQHIFVVLHRCLARWTPGGPEINQPHLSSYVLQSDGIASSNRNDVFDRLVSAANSQSTLNGNLYICDSLDNRLDIFIESINCIYTFWWELL